MPACPAALPLTHDRALVLVVAAPYPGRLAGVRGIPQAAASHRAPPAGNLGGPDARGCGAGETHGEEQPGIGAEARRRFAPGNSTPITGTPGQARNCENSLGHCQLSPGQITCVPARQTTTGEPSGAAAGSTTVCGETTTLTEPDGCLAYASGPQKAPDVRPWACRGGPAPIGRTAGSGQRRRGDQRQPVRQRQPGRRAGCVVCCRLAVMLAHTLVRAVREVHCGRWPAWPGAAGGRQHRPDRCGRDRAPAE